MAVELNKGLLLALHLGRLKDAGDDPAGADQRRQAEQRPRGDRDRRTCRTILGGSPASPLEYPVLRHANNLESVLTYEGTSEVHQLAIGRALTGISAYR